LNPLKDEGKYQDNRLKENHKEMDFEFSCGKRMKIHEKAFMVTKAFEGELEKMLVSIVQLDKPPLDDKVKADLVREKRKGHDPDNEFKLCFKIWSRTIPSFNVIRFFFTHDRTIWVEKDENGSLYRIPMESGSNVDKAEQSTADFFLQVLVGLHGLHQYGIVHRDLKRDNVVSFPFSASKVFRWQREN
jgi:serine/threonine protein kinase